MKNTFAKNLKKYREEKKLTQRRLAEMAGITATSISSYEKEAMSPSLEIVEKLAGALNVNIVDLICDSQLSDINITTYTDIMKLLYAISKKTKMLFYNDVEFLEDTECYTLNSFGFKEKVLDSFLEAWGKMYILVRDGVIEESLLDYWMRQQFELYNDEVIQTIPSEDE